MMSVKGHQKSSSTGRFTEHFDNVIAVPVETASRQQQLQLPSRGLSLRRNNNRNSLPPTSEDISQPLGQPEPLSPETSSPHRFPQKQPPQPLQQQAVQQQQSMPVNSGVVDDKDLSKRNSRGLMQQANTFPQTISKAIE